MGDIGIIARRLSPDYVQYGWSGNGCNYKSLGSILLEYYNTPELVEYLFGLGQLSLLYTPYSEKENVWLRNMPTGKPHWVGQPEREIFSKIMFIDYGYFYDSDKRWYYVVPGPFRIKIPLELVRNNLDHSEYEFDFRNQEVQQQVIKKIHSIYETNEELRKRVNDAGLSDEQARESHYHRLCRWFIEAPPGHFVVPPIGGVWQPTSTWPPLKRGNFSLSRLYGRSLPVRQYTS